MFSSLLVVGLKSSLLETPGRQRAHRSATDDEFGATSGLNLMTTLHDGPQRPRATHCRRGTNSACRLLRRRSRGTDPIRLIWIGGWWDGDDLDQVLEPGEIAEIVGVEREPVRQGGRCDQQVHRPSSARLAPRRDHSRVDPPVDAGCREVEGELIERVVGTLDQSDSTGALLWIGCGLRSGCQLGHRDRGNRELDRQVLWAEQLEVDYDRCVQQAAWPSLLLNHCASSPPYPMRAEWGPGPRNGRCRRGTVCDRYGPRRRTPRWPPRPVRIDGDGSVAARLRAFRCGSLRTIHLDQAHA